MSCFTGIELRVYGGAFVKWSEKKDELEKTQIEHSAEEIYFNDHFVLWGQGKTLITLILSGIELLS